MSYLLASIGIISMWLVESKWRLYGWSLSILQQIIWIFYALHTQQYGFIIGAIAASFVFVRNFSLCFKKQHVEHQR